MKLVRLFPIVLLGSIIMNKSAFAYDDMEHLDAKTFLFTAAVGFVANVFVSNPKTIVETNAYAMLGLGGLMGMVKAIDDGKFISSIMLHGYTQKQLAMIAAAGYTVGFAAARLVNLAVRSVYSKAKGTAYTQTK